jgi:hypothetical protein
MVTLTLSVTGSPKKRLVDMALGKCGILDYDADQAAFVLNELDALMLTWPFDQLGYVPADYGTGSLEDLTGIDPKWDLAVALSLAQGVAPLMMNATPLSGHALAQLATQMSLLRASVATLPTGVIVSAPAGEGNRRFGRFSRFIHET